MTGLPVSRSGTDAQSVAIAAAREAGAILLQYFRHDNRIEAKGNRNLVTQADLAAEKAVLGILAAEYPDHSILCEESGTQDRSSAYRWIVDPLDGTTNYAFGIAHFAVSIALACQDDIVLGVLYDPVKAELFRAQAGTGAFLNDTPLRVAARQDLKTTIIGFDIGYDDTASREMLDRANTLWDPEIAFRLLGSGALGITYVACGRMDLYFHRSLYPWDIAAAILVLREAGGEVLDISGEPADYHSSRIVACRDFNLYRELVAALTQ